MNKFFTVLFLFISTASFCQIGGMSISPTGSAPDPSAGLDVNFPNKGLLMPRITQGQRDSIAAPALGLEIYNTTDNCIEVYGFGYWQSVTCLCSGPPSTPSVISGNSNPCANSANGIYAVGLVLGASTYTWSVPSDAVIIAGQGTNSITVNFGVAPGNISVSANNNCGSSGNSTLPVTINTIPATPGAITGIDTVCANTTGNVYSIDYVAGATTYNWLLPSGTVTAGQGTNTATVSFGATQGNMSVTAGNVCGNSAASVLPIVFPSEHGLITFTYSGNQQSFVVPQCVSSLNITAYGAQGGSGNDGPGGYGGSATGNLTVTPGTTIYLYIGGQPVNSNGGYNGGGTGYGSGLGGGGGSDVRVGGTDLSNRVIVAGGGGSATSDAGWVTVGGTGGGATGGDGTSNNGSAYCGQGGTQSAGGGGAQNYSGGPGSLGQGGSASTTWPYDPGGGGGYYGGGGGGAGGAGGGSGYIGGVSGGSMQNGVQIGNGQVVINW